MPVECDFDIMDIEISKNYYLSLKYPWYIYLLFANLPEHIFVWNEALKSLHKHIFISEKQRYTESPSCAGHISPKLIQFFSDMMAVSCV